MDPFWEIAVGIAAGLLFSVFLIIRYRSRTRISRKAIADWLQELGLLLRHRVPVTIALVGCADEAPDKLTALSYRLRKSVSEGEMLSSVLARELALPQSALAIIAAGESYGTLPDALIDAAEMLRWSGKKGIRRLKAPPKSERESDEQRRIYEVAASIAGDTDLNVNCEEEVAPLVRIAHSILAQAIKSGAEYIVFEPVRTQKPPRTDQYPDEEEWKLMDMEIGPQLLITFGKGTDRWEAMRVPKYITAPLYRRLKVMAEVPYWVKPPVNGRIAVRMGNQDFNMYLDSESHPLGEKLTLEIREAE